MLVWGTATDSDTIGHTPSFACSNCSTDAPQQIVRSYKWGHLWYLGAIIKKHYQSVCSTCGTGTDLSIKKVEDDFKPSYPFNRSRGWMVWVAAFAAIMVIGFVSDQKTGESKKNYLAAPKAGDIFIMDVKSITGSSDGNDYALMRVKTVTDDALEFEPSKFVYQRSKGAKKALDNNASEPGFFLAEPISVPRAKLTQMNSSGEIIEIRR
ncbi:hypothetical protein [Massilia glaciei]|uniref:Zinc-ribbon domain-containing protein n=1 Tax=Massilia glaciei TaxID=1524097 RepID=A0A2U2HIU2_9BURK|nr:hypothetical protein [Massilia glaciei]PWF46734.1 hypothetical protein C7C56_015585 [Massilia glaciei]